MQNPFSLIACQWWSVVVYCQLIIPAHDCERMAIPYPFVTLPDHRSNHPQIFPWTEEFASPVIITPLLRNPRRNHPQSAVQSQKTWHRQHDISPGRARGNIGGRSLGAPVDEREAIKARLMTMAEVRSDGHSPRHSPRHLQRATSTPRLQVLHRIGCSNRRVTGPSSRCITPADIMTMDVLFEYDNG